MADGGGVGLQFRQPWLVLLVAPFLSLAIPSSPLPPHEQLLMAVVRRGAAVIMVVSWSWQASRKIVSWKKEYIEKKKIT
jgi:hypothetical protein